MTPDEAMAALGEAPLFHGFTETGLRIFASIAKERKIPAGSPLFVENLHGESLFVVVAGAIRITQKKPDGAEQEVAHAGPGDSLGELAVLAPGVRLVSAVAASDCRVLEIGQRDFHRLVPQKPQACLKLATAVAALVARRAADCKELLRGALARAAP